MDLWNEYMSTKHMMLHSIACGTSYQTTRTGCSNSECAS